MPGSTAATGEQDNPTIELHADTVDALFHPFDRSSLSRRTVATEADAYVVDRVADLPEDSRVSLRVLLPSGEEARCGDVEEAFRRHYAACAARERRLLKRHFREAGFMLLKGAIFALILISVAKSIASISDSLLLGKIADGLSLIVWVSLWRPVDMLIYEWRPIMEEVKLRGRLARVNIRCSTI